MKSDNYIVVLGWMINELNLTGNDLLVYALIYGFSQDGESQYTGGRTYISKSLNISIRTVSRILSDLEDRNLIKKETAEYNGVKLNKYQVTKCHGVGQNVTVSGQNVTGDGDKMSHNNTNIYNTNYNNKSKAFVKPDIHEVDAYCRERGNNINAEAFIDYYESNGWMVGRNKMKDWKACVRTWEKKNFERPKKEKTNSFNDFNQREYDADEIERRALQRRL